MRVIQETQFVRQERPVTVITEHTHAIVYQEPLLLLALVMQEGHVIVYPEPLLQFVIVRQERVIVIVSQDRPVVVYVYTE